MKTNRTVFALASFASFALFGVLVCPRSALAESPDALGAWEGSGTVSDPTNPQASGSFTIALTRTAHGAGVVRTEGRIHTADGHESTFWQDKTDIGSGRFSIASNLGSGAGLCFTNRICQSIENAADGRSYAATIAVDGPGQLRIVVTELKDGKAVRFFAESLVKKP